MLNHQRNLTQTDCAKEILMYICTRIQYKDTNKQSNKQYPKGGKIQKQTIMATIYTTSQINKEFKIKVFGIFEGKKINTLVGVSGLIRIIGQDMANKMFKRAFRSMDDKCECKLRRGIKVTFYCF